MFLRLPALWVQVATAVQVLVCSTMSQFLIKSRPMHREPVLVSILNRVDSPGPANKTQTGAETSTQRRASRVRRVSNKFNCFRCRSSNTTQWRSIEISVYFPNMGAATSSERAQIVAGIPTTSLNKKRSKLYLCNSCGIFKNRMSKYYSPEAIGKVLRHQKATGDTNNVLEHGIKLAQTLGLKPV